MAEGIEVRSGLLRSHLSNAARDWQAFLSARRPEYSWIVTVRSGDGNSEGKQKPRTEGQYPSRNREEHPDG